VTAIRSLILAGSAGLSLALAPALPAAAQDLANPRSDFVEDLPTQEYINVTTRTPRGHRIGKPEADAELIEFISYTCSHCADFARRADGTLDVVAIGPGRIAVEVRPVIRNYLDLVVTMLVQCGDTQEFKDRHRMFLYSQDEWLTEAINAPQSQQAIWARADANARLSAARALDLDDKLTERGMTLPQVNACLTDEALASTILANDRADRAEFGITGTPTFALDGKVLTEAHDWPTLASALQQRFRPPPQESVSDAKGSF
jgi:protein-disulfide isomerase